jgi:steroid delta-isomerase
MPTPTEMREALTRYLECVGRRDVEGVLALMADDVSVEDPVDGPPGTHVVGREKVGRFFRRGFAASAPSPREPGPIRTTAKNRAAMAFVLELDLAGRRSELDVIDVVTFDDDGMIRELRAYWNLDEARPRVSKS